MQEKLYGGACLPLSGLKTQRQFGIGHRRLSGWNSASISLPKLKTNLPTPEDTSPQRQSMRRHDSPIISRFFIQDSYRIAISLAPEIGGMVQSSRNRRTQMQMSIARGWRRSESEQKHNLPLNWVVTNRGLAGSC